MQNKLLVIHVAVSNIQVIDIVGQGFKDTRNSIAVSWGSRRKNQRCINFKSIVIELNIYLRYIKAGLQFTHNFFVNLSPT